MSELALFLDLAPDQAVAQWRRIVARSAALRQESFLPVETLLAFGLFFVLRPNRYGGGNIDTAPRPVHQLAATCKRTAGSFTNKMLNLDGSREHGQRVEPLLFHALARDPTQFTALYCTTLEAARRVGLGPAQVPDFLGMLDGGLGLLPLRTLDAGPVEPEEAAVARLARGYQLGEAEAVAVLRDRRRIAEHRYAAEVLGAWEHECALCGAAPRAVPAAAMLDAVRLRSARSAPEKQFEVRNALAACPTHGRAVVERWLWFEDDGRVVLGEGLRADVLRDPGMARWFGAGGMFPRIAVQRVEVASVRGHRA